MIKQNSKKQIQFWAGILVSVACLAAIFLLIDPQEILVALSTANYGFLMLSALGVVAFLLLRAVRWQYMLNNQVAWQKVFHIQNIGYLLTFILPFRLGDLARAVLIGNVPPVTLSQGISTMVVERLFDLIFIVTLLPFTLATVDTVPPAIQQAARLSSIIAMVGIVIIVIAANRRALAQNIASAVLDKVPALDKAAWMRRVDEILIGLNSLTRLKDGLILALLSVLIWLPIVLAYYSAMLAVHLRPTLAMAGFVVCAAALSITAPSSPGQVGVFHAGVTFALVQVLRQPEAPSASFAFLYHALNFLTVILFGLIGVYSIGATLGKVVTIAQNAMGRKRQSDDL